MIASNNARISHHMQNCFFLFVRASAVIHMRLQDRESRDLMENQSGKLQKIVWTRAIVYEYEDIKQPTELWHWHITCLDAIINA